MYTYCSTAVVGEAVFDAGLVAAAAAASAVAVVAAVPAAGAVVRLPITASSKARAGTQRRCPRQRPRRPVPVSRQGRGMPLSLPTFVQVVCFALPSFRAWCKQCLPGR